MRRTKIVCTLGPATSSPEIIRELILAGMDVARFNLSHGTHESHAELISRTRAVAQELARPVAVMLDTKGPEIRVGDVPGGELLVEEGQMVTLTGSSLPRPGQIPLKYERLAEDIRPGNIILIDDGLIELEVMSTAGTEVICLARTGGLVKSSQGVNVPGVKINLPAVSAEDRNDILFGLRQGVDYIAASMIRSAADILEIRHLVEDMGGGVRIIAKIETRQAVENFEEILYVADGIMVARGDLGVEIPTEEVPLIQKEIIRKTNEVGKPVITATQMLESMIENSRPTRAEASDVANAILDGSDALMLSGETSVGRYPVEAVRTMVRIAERVEQAGLAANKQWAEVGRRSITDSIGHATCLIAREVGASAILTPTTSGFTPRMVSKYRPSVPIVAATPDARVQRMLALVWGVVSVLVPEETGTDETIASAVKAALELGLIKTGDLIVVTAGVPVGVPGTTNLVKVHLVGDVLAAGTGVGQSVARGPAKIVWDSREVDKVNEGDILVTRATNEDFVPAIRKAAGIVAELGGLTSHAAIAGLSMKIPVIVGAEGILGNVRDGEVITVDSRRGYVYRG